MLVRMSAKLIIHKRRQVSVFDKLTACRYVINFADKQSKCLTLDVELLPGLAAHHHDGDTGRDAGEQQVQHPALPEVLRSVVDLAAPAPVAEAACQHVYYIIWYVIN